MENKRVGLLTVRFHLAMDRIRCFWIEVSSYKIPWMCSYFLLRAT